MPKIPIKDGKFQKKKDGKFHKNVNKLLKNR